MTLLAGFSGKEVVRRLEQIGYRMVRQKGSHARLVHTDPTRRKITVPLHKEIGVGLLTQIIKDSGMSVKHFLGSK